MPDSLDDLYEELDNLRAPRSYPGRKHLGITIGPYIQGNPERGYGGRTLTRIREIRKKIERLEND